MAVKQQQNIVVKQQKQQQNTMTNFFQEIQVALGSGQKNYPKSYPFRK